MREIKFRAWDDEAKKMYSPEELEQADMPEMNKSIYGYLSFGTLLIYDFKSDSEPVELLPLQSTGWFDNDQQEIYEGDVVENSEGIYQVIWSEEVAGFILLGNDGSMAIGGPYMSDTFKLKGNIYENPDLLQFNA